MFSVLLTTARVRQHGENTRGIERSGGGGGRNVVSIPETEGRRVGLRFAAHGMGIHCGYLIGSWFGKKCRSRRVSKFQS